MPRAPCRPSRRRKPSAAGAPSWQSTCTRWRPRWCCGWKARASCVSAIAARPRLPRPLLAVGVRNATDVADGTIAGVHSLLPTAPVAGRGAERGKGLDGDGERRLEGDLVVDRL